MTDVNDQLSGIVTDKDLAFRVIAEGLDPHNTYLGEIMTRNPCTVTTSHNATDALNEMVNGGFRHLVSGKRYCLKGAIVSMHTERSSDISATSTLRS